MYPGCPAGVAMVYIVGFVQMAPVIGVVLFRMVTDSVNVANLAAEICANDPSI